MEIPASSLPAWKSDRYTQMMNVHRNCTAEDILSAYKHMQEQELFTDTELVSGDGVKNNVHSLVLLASSELLKHWMETTRTPNMQFTIILPDVSGEVLECLISILYGVEMVVPSQIYANLCDLVDLLGISIDLPIRTDQSLVEESLYPPMCCWHCNSTFARLEELEEHVKVHQGEIFKRKHHKCQQCKKVLPSMWKLRQHLASHKLLPTMREEHQQSTERRAEVPPSSDHPYASAPTEGTRPESEEAARLRQKSPVSRRITDHLYSARKLSKKEAADLAAKKEQQLQMKKSDHLYSTPSSPSSPSASTSGSAVAVVGGHPNLPSADKRSFRIAAKKQTVQALGHSYAAARPRKASSSALTVAAMMEGGAKRKSEKDSKMLQCDQCQKEFPQPYRLDRHIREVHMKERKHTCRVCDKTFFKLTSKERHELTHTEHELWKCAKCFKAFRDQSSLNYHTSRNVCLKLKRK